MKLHSVTLHHIKMTLKTPFVNSLETVNDRELIVVEAKDTEGYIGFGEGVAFTSPWYTEETLETSWHMLKDFMIPTLKAQVLSHPSDVEHLLKGIRRNPMAKYAIEGAIWDLYAKREGISLAEALGGTAKRIKAGVAVGASEPEVMLNEISKRIEEGYERIKVKIKPSQDLSLIRAIRKFHPSIDLMADANSAYTLNDIERLKKLDQYGLLMIEQPLAADDIVDHALLQKELATPVCLDESIASFDDARRALSLNSCRIINIKPGRVGGLSVSKKIHDLCASQNIPVWCGGMLESGIGRAHNIALSSLPNFTIPGDVSASSRYWERDIILPEVIVENGSIAVPDDSGIGFELNRKELERVTLAKEIR
ncbi:o-succinylbenzoate synthase [Guptibacillus hwajinpoensis]|uniref:o-succinylbenzoate synthase n=1 Tax=Guptibacillus hwajinpoensis TaxID=208199 RepID=A0ABU0JVS0_9BACL|nr:o-succinylbenzoate synthase [Alkalihalobacillus hemicentroti]MDQ0481183.1 O-succinylbenzoate synthase [Alkalihalobacillus hemicentroti]